MIPALLLLLAPVLQDTAPAPHPGGVLEPISVRDSTATTAPLARTVLSASDLAGLRAGAFLDEALARAAGVVAESRGSFALDTRLVIRGAGARAAFGVRGVTVLLDGVPQTLPDGQAGLGQVDVAALDHVEVVRGAAGAFYGNGAGGVLLLTSPGLIGVRDQLTVRAVGGSNGSGTLTARASGRIGSGGAAFSFSQLQQDGWRRYAHGLMRRASATIAWPASGSTVVRGRVTVADLARAENPGALDSAQLAADPRQALARNVAFRAGKRATEWQGSLDVAHTGAASDLSAVVFGVTRDLDNPLASSYVKLSRTDGGARLSGRFALAAGSRLAPELLAGLDVQQQVDDRANYANDSGSSGARTLDQTETVLSAGGRLGIRFVPAGRTAVTAGVRADRVRFQVDDHFLSDGDASGSRTMGAFSYTGALERRMGAWRGWASVGTAFETPTTTELARPGLGGFNPAVNPQHTLQGEIGVGWADQAGSFTVTAYQSRVTDALVQYEEPTQPGRFYFANAARVRLRGVEAEAGALVRPWLRLAVAVTFASHRYTSYPTDSVDLSGKLVPGLPVRSGYALATFGRPGGAQGELELVSEGTTWADDANSAAAPAWKSLNLRAGAPLLGVHAFGGVRNALGARIVGSVNVNGANRRFFEPAPGRTWYVGLDTRLGY